MIREQFLSTGKQTILFQGSRNIYDQQNISAAVSYTTRSDSASSRIRGQSTRRRTESPITGAKLVDCCGCSPKGPPAGRTRFQQNAKKRGRTRGRFGPSESNRPRSPGHRTIRSGPAAATDGAIAVALRFHPRQPASLVVRIPRLRLDLWRLPGRSTSSAVGALAGAHRPPPEESA